MATKEKDVLGHIIELYKDMPYLWNKNDKNYMNKSIRCEGFEVKMYMYQRYGIMTASVFWKVPQNHAVQSGTQRRRGTCT